MYLASGIEIPQSGNGDRESRNTNQIHNAFVIIQEIAIVCGYPATYIP